MLRLRPSELTLTPEDVEDCFRRLTQRQASRASATAASRISATAVSQGLERHGRPIIRRGPQRSPRDSITLIRNDGLLRLPPQYAVISSVNDVDHTEPSTPPASSYGQPPQESSATTSPGLRPMHLPLRLGPDHATGLRLALGEGEQPSITPVLHSPRHTASRTVDADSHSPVRQAVTPIRSDTPIETHAGLRGGGCDGSSKDRTHVDEEDSAPSSPGPRLKSSQLHMDPSPDPVKVSAPLTEEAPVCFLHGYFKSPLEEPLGISYHFKESVVYPKSEPRPRTSRQAVHARSLSSGSVPAHDPRAPRQEAVEHADAGYFGAFRDTSSGLYAPSPSAGLRQRQFSSELSAESAPFSYYGSLPSESRHSSSEQPSIPNPSRPQYDGTTAWNDDRSSHQRMRSLGNSNDSLPPHPIPHGSRPVPVQGPPAFPPLLPNPHARVSGHRLIPPPPDFGPPAWTSGFPDATDAAARDLRSPLDNYSEQYQRLAEDHHLQSFMPSRLRTPQPYPGNHATSSRSLSGGASREHVSTFNNNARTLTWDYQPPLPARSHPSARLNQRSIGNRPASPPSTDNRAARGQVQTQRAAYELLQNASRAMQSINLRTPGSARPGSGVAPTPSPQDLQGRNRIQGPRQLPIRPVPRGNEGAFLSSSPPYNSGDHSRSRAPVTGTGYGSPPLPLPGSQRPQRTHRQVSTTSGSSLYLQPSRDSPLTSLALDHGSGVTSRRSRSSLPRATTTARTYRRVPVHQRDQENSAEAEMNAMRREEAAVSARYGEDGQRYTMDETPPRLGRAERGMFE